MSFYLEKVFIKNFAPFENISLDFKDKGINVITGLNGKGKTTILSYIADALIEFSKKVFFNEYKDKRNMYYRISSPFEVLDIGLPAIVYIRFRKDNQNLDYLNASGTLSESEYEKIPIDEKILYGSFSDVLNNDNHLKTVSGEDKAIKSIFDNNVITYFPFYRFEVPGYLNDVYKAKAEFNYKPKYSGHLKNPIEVVHSLDFIYNWVFDVVLDLYNYRETQQVVLKDGKTVDFDVTEENHIWKNLSLIITEVFKEKSNNQPLRFGIGTRDSTGNRLSILSDDKNKIYAPNLSMISAGESSIIGIFVELLRQADNLKRNIHNNEISGIVLIDEIDKHLHMRLQKDVLPRMLNLFPNVQFIITSHSTFFNMGLAEQLKDRSIVFDLDNNGLQCEPEMTVEFENFYSSVLRNNENYKNNYLELKSQTENLTKPLIFTEGKTDWKHLKHALNIFQEKGEFTDIDINFFEYDFTNGDSKLSSYLNTISFTPFQKKIIGIFDCDEDNGRAISKQENGIKKYGDCVYAMSIPIPDFRSNMSGISIEFLYTDEDMKQEDEQGRRLYTTDEFNDDGRLIENVSIGIKNADKLKEAHRTTIPKVIDREVISVNSEPKTLSKDAFAEKICSGEFKINDLSGFKAVFDRLRIIIN